MTEYTKLKIEKGKYYLCRNGYVLLVEDILDKHFYICIYPESEYCGQITYFIKDNMPYYFSGEERNGYLILEEIGKPPTLPSGYRYKDGLPTFRIAKSGEYYIGALGVNHYATTQTNVPVWIIEPLDKFKNVDETTETITEGEKISKTKKIGSYDLSLVQKMVNYWMFEPTKEIASRIMKSVRYAVLFTVITGGTYAYYNPDTAKDFIKSCIPKVTIEKPEILS